MKYLALTGGVGGAKLALGLAKILIPDEVQFVVNTGDDFEHLGFHVSPDVDTLTYTLAEVANTDTGWGRAGETWQFIEAFDSLGGESWFKLGDRDLALHVYRRERLAAGASLTEVTCEIAQRLGIEHTIVPMSDDPVRTIVHTTEGPLAFQHYFVRDRCKPIVTGFDFDGVQAARLNPVIDFDALDGVIICPSNPFVSVDPVLAVPGMREALATCGAPIVAVSPIVGGIAIKGPTAKMMAELDVPSTTVKVAEHYRNLLTGFVIDEQDRDARAEVEALGMAADVQQSVMITLDDRTQLARAVLDFVAALNT